MIQIGTTVRYGKLKNCIVVIKDDTHVVIEYNKSDGKKGKLCTPISGFKENDIINNVEQKNFQLTLF